MSDVIISVEKLSKRYRLGQIGVTTLRDSFERWWHRVRGRDPNEHMGVVEGRKWKVESGKCSVESGKWKVDGENKGENESVPTSSPPPDTSHLPPPTPSPSTSNLPPSTSSLGDELWALKDVSFEVKRGEVLGIIGRNGAGKSTLLKILSRITEPTSGRAILRGRVGSLLEVGTGFHPELSGRENIYLNGAILGMKKKEIDDKFDEIVAFSEVERFIDTPVKRYSSGMYVRLAFAVAAHLEPEILLVDEVLAVGDASFQKKCLGKMGDVAKEGRTVLFVSHNMAAVQTLCHSAFRLDQGRQVAQGHTHEVVSEYLRLDSTEKLEQSWEEFMSGPGNENARVVYAAVQTAPSHDRHYLTVSTPIHLDFRILNLRPDAPLHFNVLLTNQDNICVFNTASRRVVCKRGIVEGVCHIPANLLNDATYTVRLLVHFGTVEGINVDNLLVFEVHDAARSTDIGWYGKWTGVVRPDLQWITRMLEEFSQAGGGSPP